MDNFHDNQKVLITKEGLEELQKEYRELVENKRPKVVDRIASAREQGDLTENSEYASARDELAFIDGRITELEDILKSAKVVNVSKKSKNSVDLGTKVHLHVNGKKETFTIVGEWEANPTEKKISHTSPLGQALIGKKVGDKVEVKAPVGTIVYKILNIE